jgi:8-oxo-dGTP diphosphatase
MAERLIEAAGGVLWRPAVGGLGVEIALVHRPKYDDWSVPKGKLEVGELPVIGAIREILEETGHRGVPGRRLGQVRYFKDGLPKRVRYWAVRAAEGSFVPTEEVDQLMWLPPREARRHIAPDRERGILEQFEADPDPTWPAVIVRHASAGDRSTWPGPDRERPLDPLGHSEAAALSRLFDLYNADRVFSADVLRCLDTVGPYAATRQARVESEPLISESGQAAHPQAAAARLIEIVSGGEPVIVCSQGRAMPDLLAAVCSHFDRPAPSDPTTRKSGGWILHLAANGKPRLVDVERFDPPA